MRDNYQQWQLDAAADAILNQPPGRRAGLLLYLLEAYDAGEIQEDAKATLRAVRDALNLRLEEGRW